MEKVELQKFKRARLIVGAVLCVSISIYLMPNHPGWGFVFLLVGFISALRGFLNGAYVVGLLLSKSCGILLVLYPLVAVAVREIFQEMETRPAGAVEQIEQPLTPQVLDAGASPAVLAPPPDALQKNFQEDVMRNTPIFVQKPLDSKVVEIPNFQFPGPFVEYFRKAESTADLDVVMKQYAEEVDYFGTKRTNAQIRADKERYWAQWPVRKETITTVVKVKPSDVNEFLIFFDSTFRNENLETGAWIEGEISSGYTVIEENKTFKVTKQVAQVLRIRKSTDQ